MSEQTNEFGVFFPNGYSLIGFNDNGRVVLSLVNSNGYCVSDVKLTKSEQNRLIQVLKESEYSE